MEISIALASVTMVNLVVDILIYTYSFINIFRVSIFSFCTALVIETCGQTDLQMAIKISTQLT